MIANQRRMTNDFIPRLAALTPNGACYLNESDFLQPDFKNVFYGKNYDRLLSIKDKYDPNHMFYATTAIGSDYWVQQADGRLCKAVSDLHRNRIQIPTACRQGESSSFLRTY